MLQVCGVWAYPSPRLWARKLMSTTYFDKLVRQPRRFWYAVIFVFLPMPLYWSGSPNDFEAHVRWHATALQMLGLWLVYKGLIDTAKRFKVPTPWSAARALLESLVPTKAKPPQTIIVSASGMSASLSGSASVAATFVAPDDSHRIKELENAVKAIRADMERVHQANTQKFKQLDKQVSSVAAELGGQINEVKSVMHAQTAGGLGESFMGLAWVAVGTLLGGLASDLPGWLHVN